MTPTKSANAKRLDEIAKSGSIPRTTLNIPMPAGAKPPPAAPSSIKSAQPSPKGK